MKVWKVAVAVVVLCGAGACTVPAPGTCPAGLSPVIEADLFFGRSMPGGTVSDADWQHFVDEEVASRFPYGFTVQDTSGQWKGERSLVREASKRLTVVLTGAPDEEADLAAIRQAYKRRFHQQSVLLVETTACGSF
jgi:hypothetical protein